MHYVYVLRSETTGRLYKGSTSDLEARIKSHNQGKVRSTKAGRPWVLVYHEEYENKTEARKRELFLKSGPGRKFLQSVL
jgi:putative endonuclease